jgi:hypothetical protein
MSTFEMTLEGMITRAEGPPRGARSAPSGGSAAAEPQAWGGHAWLQ